MLLKHWAIILILCLFACSEDSHVATATRWMKPNNKVKVLSTIAMIGNLVDQVGGEHIDNLILIKGELDPHSYQLVKGDDEKFAFADIILYNGLGLEHGPSLQKLLYKNPKSIGLGDEIQKKHPELILQYQGQTDPHIWMDASLWAKTVPDIVKALSEKDPEHAAYYSSNGEKLIEEMNQVHQKTRAQLMQVPDEKRFLVTSHDAFNYFTRAYLASEEEQQKNNWQKRFAAPEGLAPESQLSATDIQNIINHLSTYGIHVLFPESNISKDSIRKILSAGKEKELDLYISTEFLYGDAMGPPGSAGDSYLKMIEHNAKTIANCLTRDCREIHDSGNKNK